MKQNSNQIQNRIGALDGLRAIAALWVALYHLRQLCDGFSPESITPIISKGYLGVDIFFVLSGFVLSHVYKHDVVEGGFDEGRFYWARLARIYPIHFITFVVAGLLNLVLWPDLNQYVRFDLSTAIGNLALVHSWGLFDRLSWNFPSWSLSAEWAAYLTFPIAISHSKVLARKPIAAICLALCLIAILAFINFYLVKNDAKPFNTTFDYGLIRAALEFWAGILVYGVFCDIGAIVPAFVKRWMTIVLFALILIILHADWGAYRIFQDAVFVVAAALFIFSLAVGNSIIDDTLKSKCAGYFGTISYGFYLWHGVLYLYLASFRWSDDSKGKVIYQILTSESFSSGLSVVIAFLVLTGGLAALSFRFVETPVRNGMRGWWDVRVPKRL